MDKHVEATGNVAATSSVRPTKIATLTRSASRPRKSSKTSSFARNEEYDAENIERDTQMNLLEYEIPSAAAR